MSEARQQPQDGYGGVEIQAGGKANCGQQRKQLSGRNLQHIEHGAGVGVLGVRS